jgi:hypothetical protein
MFFDFFNVELDESESIKKLLLKFQFSGIAKPVLKAYINGIYVGQSEKIKQGAISVSEAEFPQFLVQGAYLQVYLTNTQTDREIQS